MSAAQHGRGAGQPDGLHVATIAHGGLIWDAYLELADDLRHPPSFRGRLRFERAAPDGTGVTAETAVIIIEDSWEEAVARARGMDERQLEGLLRSALPDR